MTFRAREEEKTISEWCCIISPIKTTNFEVHPPSFFFNAKASFFFWGDKCDTNSSLSREEKSFALRSQRKQRKSYVHFLTCGWLRNGATNYDSRRAISPERSAHLSQHETRNNQPNTKLATFCATNFQSSCQFYYTTLSCVQFWPFVLFICVCVCE